MKKLLLTAAATLVSVALFAQGTIGFSNSGGSKVSTGVSGSASATWVVMPNTGAGLFNFGVFYGIGQSTSLTFLATPGVNSTSVAGTIANSSDNKAAIPTLQIPGTIALQANVYIQVAGWSASFGTDWEGAKAASLSNDGKSYFGTSTIVNTLPLGPSGGPGNSLWQSATGTDVAKLKGFALLTTVPEPSSMALIGLGTAALMIFRRRK